MLSFISLLVSVLLIGGCANSVTIQSTPLGSGSSLSNRLAPAKFSKPPGKGPFPAVVLLHAAGGVQSHVSIDWPTVLNENGYATLTVDSCGSSSSQRCVQTRNDWIVRVWSDATGALDYLASVPEIDPKSIAVMGFSAGALAIEGGIGQSAASPMKNRFKAGIAVYGQCSILGELNTPMLEIIGEEDRNAERCRTQTRWDASAKQLTEVEIIPGATHAFDQREITTLTMVNGDHQAVYSEKATANAHRGALRFLKRHLGSPH